MSDEFICDKCQNKFKSLNTLNCHKKNAIYCLKLNDINTEILDCEYCKKTFNRSYNQKRHMSKCKTKIIIELKEELSNKDKIIIELKEELSNKDKSNIEIKEELKLSILNFKFLN